jgi:hypothetical protein
MKPKKTISFMVLFLLLTAFSAVSLGFVDQDRAIVTAVSALEDDDDDDSDTYVLTDDEFDAKVFKFLEEQKVCALTDGQAVTLGEAYPFENKLFIVEGEEIMVLYSFGNPINKNIIEKTLGEDLDKKCHVVHGNKVAAMVTPLFVS